MSDKPVALITGAARGIGRETALEFARRGYDLGLLDVLSDELQATARRAMTLGAAVEFRVADLGEEDLGQSALRELAASFGRLDVLVNNAAWRELQTLRETTLESWERTLRICLIAPAFLARAAAEIMEQQRRGVIVNVCSIMSQRGGALAPAYAAAKGGLDSLTYDLAALYGRAGIRVVAISPGAIDTDLSGDYPNEGDARVAEDLRAWSEDEIPLGRWGYPAEIARMIAMLASDEASYLHGTNVVVDGGWSHGHFPRTLLRRMRPDQFPQRDAKEM